MAEWATANIGRVADRVTKGTTPTSVGYEFSAAGIPFVKVESITASGTIDTSKLAYISEDTHQALGRSQLYVDDVLFTIAGTIGRVARVTAEFSPANTNQAVAIIRPDRRMVHPRFVLYCLRDRRRILGAQSRIVQSVQANLSLSELRSVEIPLPSLGEQRAIVAVLGALDDKIAVNERIATTALELADALFGQATLGLDFSAENFGSVAAVAGGGTPSTKVDDYWGGRISWTTPSDVTALSFPYLFETSRNITELGLENCASQIYPAQSIFMTSRATIGAFALPQVPAAVNQGFIVVLPPSDDMRWWLLHEMRSRVSEMISLANGSTFLELSRKNFKAMQIRLPEETEVAAFASKAAPLHAAAAQVSRENRTLSTLRDTLLPQLVSGRLRVKDAEQIVEHHV